ncbi:MAG: NDP-sugar synthase [Clostridia bacterium]|nr:NDP-sugar synthase [Clostridia bacterium]
MSEIPKQDTMHILPIIMAGGEGSRLRPITETMPKPLVPVDGVPAICRILDTLAAFGYARAVITVRYRGDDIRTALGSSYHGIALSYADEANFAEPLGTAGGVRAAWDTFSAKGDTDALILSGDAVFSADLNAFLNLHHASAVNAATAASASILCVRVSDPSAYGVVLTDREGRITGFSEKPSVSEAVSDTVNTGIYLLSAAFLARIAKDIPQDFGQDIFPLAIRDHIPMQMYLSEGYWCDIGSFDAYLDCCLDMASGRISGFAPSRVLLPPHISDSCIGRDCFLPSTSSVRQSVLFDRVVLGAGASVSGSILCRDVKVGAMAVIEAGCVVGEGAVIEDHAHLPRGTRAAPGAVICADKKEFAAHTDSMSESIQTEDRARRYRFDGGINIAPYLTDIGYALCAPACAVPDIFVCAAAANAFTAYAKKTGQLLLLAYIGEMCGDNPALTAALHLMREAIACSGHKVIVCEEALPSSVIRMPELQSHILQSVKEEIEENVQSSVKDTPIFRVCLTMYDGRPTAAIYDALGLYPERSAERTLDTLFADALMQRHFVTEPASVKKTAYTVARPAKVTAAPLVDAYLCRYAVPFSGGKPFLFRMGQSSRLDGETIRAACCDTDEALLERLLLICGGKESFSAPYVFRIAPDEDDGLTSALSVTDLQNGARCYTHWEIVSLLAAYSGTDYSNTDHSSADKSGSDNSGADKSGADKPFTETLSPAAIASPAAILPFPTPRMQRILHKGHVRNSAEPQQTILSLPIRAPQMAEFRDGAGRVNILRYSHCPTLPSNKGQKEELNSASFASATFARHMAALEAEDGVLLAQRLALLLSMTQKSLSELFEASVFSARKNHTFTRCYATAPAGAVTATLRRMTEETASMAADDTAMYSGEGGAAARKSFAGSRFTPDVEGVVYRGQDGSTVRVVATRQKNFRIIADAYSTEAAGALCQFAKERLLCAAVSEKTDEYR